MGHDTTSKLSQDNTADAAITLSTADLQLLNAYQKGFPLVPEPYAHIARQLGLEESEVIQRLQRLNDSGIVSRIGVVLRTGKAGASTLAALEVPNDELERVAAVVSSYPEVNHNYEREHKLNLWFVVTAANSDRLTEILTGIEGSSGSKVHILPMLDNFHIDLGFPI